MAAKNQSRTTIGRKANGVGSDTSGMDTGSSKSKRTTVGQTRKGIGLKPLNDSGRITDKTNQVPAGTPVVTNPIAALARSGSTGPSLSATPSVTATGTGGGTGGGTGNNGSGGALTGQDLTGWAAGIRPDAIPMMYQEPQALLRQVMAKMGMSANDNPGLYNLALPNADLVNALSLVFMGADPGFQQGENNQVLNAMGDFFAQGLTRGGQGVDFSQGIDNIIGTGANSDTALGGYLNLDDPRGQVNAVKSLIAPLAQAGLHPLFARALDNQINRLADEYYQQYGFGSNPPANFQSKIDRLF